MLGTPPVDLPIDRLWAERETSPSARDELVRRHLALAEGLAARYRNVNDPFEDLVQVATLGLIKAVDRFDPDFGASFVSYAAPTILGELKRYFRDTGWSLHVPRGAKEAALEVRNAADELVDATGRSPTVTEIAIHLGRRTEDVVAALEAANAHFADSLDAPLSGSDDDSLDITLLDHAGAADDGYGLSEMRASLPSAISRLPYHERRALELRMREAMTQTEIATQLGCSQMHVSRLLRRAAERMREHMQLED